MANKPLKTIKFPGLSDTYTVPQIDNTLEVTGAAADAKKVGDEISDLKDDLDNKVDSNQGSSNVGKSLVVGDDGIVGLDFAGLSDDAKEALMNCFSYVAWIGEDGKQRYDSLYEALYGTLPPDQYLVFDYKASRDGLLSEMTNDIAVYTNNQSAFSERLTQSGNLRVEGTSTSDGTYYQMVFNKHTRIKKGKIVIRAELYRVSSVQEGMCAMRIRLASSEKDATVGFGKKPGSTNTCNVLVSYGSSYILAGEISISENWHIIEYTFDTLSNNRTLIIDGNQMHNGILATYGSSSTSIMFVADFLIFIDTIQLYVYEE